jgi:FKBP-type peptidyl-prolyl cis-trans isomerase
VRARATGADRAAIDEAAAPSRRRAVLLSSAAAALAAAVSAARPARADDEGDLAPVAVEEAAPTPAAPPQQQQQAEVQAVSAASQSDDGTGDVSLLTTDAAERQLTPTDRQVLALNRRVQAQNRAPLEFPAFVRQGFDIKIIADGYVADADGLVYRDYDKGDESKPLPIEGQEVVFDYVGYNESGAVIDSSYRQGRPSQTRLGVKGLIPGFELGLRGMRPGGKRRVVVPPALGPPVGPQTFFSAKQCEVFDVEMHEIRDCERRTVGMFSNVVCTPVA